MAQPPHTANQIQAEYDERLAFKKIDAVISVIGLALKFAAIVMCFRYGYLSVVALAGKSTFADVGFRILGNLKVSEGISYIFGAGGILYGAGQRRLRRRNIERIVPLKNKLEKILDRKRTSSSLTSKGTTRPEDER
jgi:hypothetical protein